MHFFGKLIKTLLRSVFSIIFFLLLVGLAKMNWDINAYIVFLNDHDRSTFHRSQLATWTDPFWPQQQTATLDDLLSGDVSESTTGSIDPYDPELEQELNELTDSSLSGSEEEFGFTTGGNDTSTGGNDTSTGGNDTSTGTASTSQLLDLIKQRELKK